MEKKSKMPRILTAGFLLTFSIFLSCSLANAAIDICLKSPIGNEMYRSGETINIHWKAENIPNCAWSIDFYYRWSSDLSKEYYIGWVKYLNEGTYYWTAPTVSSEDYLQIVVKMSTDGGGICDSAASGSLTIMPAGTERTLNLIAPNPTSCDNNNLVLGAGDPYEIIWDASGCFWNSIFVNLYYATSYTFPGGFNWQLITPYGVPCSSGSYTWTVPDADTINGRIKVEWDDLSADSGPCRQCKLLRLSSHNNRFNPGLFS